MVRWSSFRKGPYARTAVRYAYGGSRRASRYQTGLSARRAAAARMSRAMVDFGSVPSSAWDSGATVGAAAAAAARSAVAMAADRRIVTRHLHAETGFDAISNTGAQVDMACRIAVGGGINQRTGREITLTGYKLSFTLESGHSDTLPLSDEYNNVRIVIALFNAPGKGVQTGPWFTSTSVDALVAPEINPGLRRVLYDQVVTLRPPYLYLAGTFEGTPATAFRHMKIYIPLAEKVTYTADGSDFSNDKQLVCYMVSDSAAPPHPLVLVGTHTLYYRG